jgi:sulfatase modifying factor 1
VRSPFLVVNLMVLCSVVGIAQESASPQTMTNSIGMEFVLIQPGSMQVGVFKPGCPDPNAPPLSFPSAPARKTDGGATGNAPAPRTAMPARDPRAAWTQADYTKCAELVKEDTSDGSPIKISKSYFIGKYEVTQGQWQRVMERNPSVFRGDKVTDDAQQHPVENITWEDAQAFVKKLNALEKTNAYHLPNEFQWEYACRAGGSGQQSWEYIRQTAVQGVAGFGAGTAAGAQAPKRPTTATVGSKQPNAWGIYDMLGNVWEWVEDPYNGKIFADSTPAKSGPEHVLKGGGFLSDLKNTICATHGAGPGDRWDVGFRVAKDSR